MKMIYYHYSFQFYSDTDSIMILEYLDPEIVDSSSLGKWKLEAEYLFCVFLGPKLYGCLDLNGKSNSKVKGFSKKVDLSILEKLLYKDETDKLVQSKWYKLIKESSIEINETSYEIRPTDKKRELVYSENKLVGIANIHINGITVEDQFKISLII